MAKKRFYYSLLAVIAAVMVLLGLFTPVKIKSLYDWELTVFVICPIVILASWAIVKADRAEQDEADK